MKTEIAFEKMYPHKFVPNKSLHEWKEIIFCEYCGQVSWRASGVSKPITNDCEFNPDRERTVK